MLKEYSWLYAGVETISPDLIISCLLSPDARKVPLKATPAGFLKWVSQVSPSRSSCGGLPGLGLDIKT